jgi:hypothetical protein
LWIAAVGVFVAASAAALTAFLTARLSPVWITAVGVAAGGAGGLLTNRLRRRGERRDVQDELLDRHTRWGVRSVGDLVDSDFGVHPAIRDTSVFIKRDLFGDVIRAMSSRIPVLIVGPSMSGKTRLAVEALRDLGRSMRVVMAESGADLASLLDQGARPTGSVVAR